MFHTQTPEFDLNNLFSRHLVQLIAWENLPVTRKVAKLTAGLTPGAIHRP